MANVDQLKTKADVLAQILKLDGPFRASNVREMLDLPKQGMNYHLKTLVEKGVLEKQGTLYLLIDRDKAIDLMLDIAHNERGLPRSRSVTFWNETSKNVRNLVDDIVKARALDLLESDKIKKYVIDGLDEAIREMQKEKKYLAEKSMSPGSARKTLWKEYQYPADWYEEFLKTLSMIDFEFTSNETARNADFNKKVEETD